jgi:hypothetical protein
LDINISTGEISDLSLIPCRKAECVVWRDRECTHIRKEGKPDKLQVWSKEVE